MHIHAKKIRSGAFLIIVFLAGLVSLRAETGVSNLDEAAQTYTNGSENGTSNRIGSCGTVSFTVGPTDYYLTGVVARLYTESYNPTEHPGDSHYDGIVGYTVSIYSNNDGQASTLLYAVETVNYAGINNGGASYYSDMVFSNSNNYLLSANTTYWLEITVRAGDNGAWKGTLSTGEAGLDGWSIGDGWYSGSTGLFSDYSKAQFAILVEQVPEPEVWTLLACGMVVALSGLRKSPLLKRSV